MAWPKRGTRKIIVDGEEFLWHYDTCCPLCSNDVFTAGKEGKPYVLFIDPFPWNFQFRPASVAAAIRWARSEGWSPESGPTRPMAMNDETEQFEWLEAHERHIACRKGTAAGT